MNNISKRPGGARHRRKGDNTEREIVNLHRDLGLHAQRVPLSGAARYRGSAHDVDVYAFGPDSAPIVCEVKSRKNGTGFTTLEKWLAEYDVLFLRRNHARSHDRAALACVGATARAGAQMTRERLANRRASETFSFECSGLKFTATVSRYGDGRLGEVFIENHKASSFAGIMASDGAIAASLALQFGCPVNVLRKALSRDARGHPSSPLGATMDLLVEREERR